MRSLDSISVFKEITHYVHYRLFTEENVIFELENNKIYFLFFNDRVSTTDFMSSLL